MKKQLRFLLFAVLAVVMCLMTMIAVSAAADGDTSSTAGFNEADYNFKVVDAGGAATYYVNLGGTTGAFASVPEGGTLYILKSVDLGSTAVSVANANSFTIEGGGNTLTAMLVMSTGDGKTVKVNNLALISSNATTRANKAFSFVGAGTTFEFTGVTVSSVKDYAFHVDAANVTIKMLGTANVVEAATNVFYADSDATGLSLLVEGGSYTASGDLVYMKQAGESVVNINAGTFAIEGNICRPLGPTTVVAFTLGAAGAADSTLTVTCEALVYATNKSAVTFTMNCGEVNTADSPFKSGGKNVSGYTMNVNGGSITAAAGNALFDTGSHANQVLNVTGGSFNIGGSLYNANVTYTITGGEFVINNISDIDNIDFKNAAKISMTSYTYKLTEDFTIASSADLVAKALENFPANTDILTLSFVIDNGAILTITGGEYKFTDKDVVDILNGGVKISDGVFESGTYVFHCNGSANASIEITGGTFKGPRVIQIDEGATASINIGGGTFDGSYAVIYSVANSTTELAISGGSLSTENGDGVIYAYGAMNLNITGGTFTSKKAGMPVFLLRQTSGSTSEKPFTFILKNATINSPRGIVFTNASGELHYDCTLEKVRWTSTSTTYGLLEVEKTANVKMSIKDSTFTAPNMFMIKGTGNVAIELDGGTYTASAKFMPVSSTSTVSLTVKNGTVKAPAELITTNAAATITVEGGTVNAVTLINTTTAVTLNVTGGTLKTSGNVLDLSGDAKATVTVSGGTFTPEGNVFVLTSGSTATVSGGVFNPTENVFVLSEGATAAVSGGEFTLTGNQAYIFGGSVTGASVTGGTFTVDNFIELIDFSQATKVIIKKSGYYEITQKGEFVINSLEDFAAILSASGSASNFEYPATGWFSLHINHPEAKVIFNLSTSIEVYTEYLVKVSQGEAVFTSGNYTAGTKTAFIVDGTGKLSIEGGSFALTGEGNTFLGGTGSDVTIGEGVKISAGDFAQVPTGELYANASIVINDLAVVVLQNKVTISVTSSAQLLSAIAEALPENVTMGSGVRWINFVLDNSESVITIERGSYSVTGKFFFKILNGTLNILAGTYQVPNGVIAVMEGGELNISTGKFYAQALVHQTAGNAKITVSNVKFNAVKAADATDTNPDHAFIFESNTVATLTLTSSTITTAKQALVLNNKARVTVEGDGIVMNTAKEYLITLSSGAVLTIKGGTFIVTDTAKSPIYSEGTSDVRVNIEGGKLVGSPSMPLIYFKDVKEGTNKLKITGGTFIGMRLFVANNSVLDEVAISGITLEKLYDDKNDTTLAKELITLQGSAGKIKVLKLADGNSVRVSGTLVSVLSGAVLENALITGGSYQAGLSSFNTQGASTLRLSVTGGTTAFAENFIKAQNTSAVTLTINGGDIATAGMDAIYFNKLDTATISVTAISGTFSINQNATVPSYTEYDFTSITVNVNSATLEIKTKQDLTLGSGDTARFAALINEQLAQYTGMFKNELAYVGTGIPCILLNHPGANLVLTEGTYTSQNDALVIINQGTLTATGVVFEGPKYGVMVKSSGKATVTLSGCTLNTADHGIYLTASSNSAERVVNLINTSVTSANGNPIYMNGGKNTVTIGTKGERDSGVYTPLSRSCGAILAASNEGATYNLTINGGRFTAGEVASTVVLNTQWSLEVNGGQIQHNTAIEYKHILELNGVCNKLLINGGTFSYAANPRVAGDVEEVKPTKANGYMTEYVKAKSGYGAILAANFTLAENATAVINGGAFNANSECSFSSYKEQFTNKRKTAHVLGINYLQENIVITINDISFAGAMFANVAKAGSQLHINGGTIVMSTTFKNNNRFISLNAEDVLMTMTGGTIILNVHSYIGIGVQKESVVVDMSGGVIEGGARQFCLEGSAGTVNISGDAILQNPEYDVNDSSKAMIQIAGGTFNIAGGSFKVPMATMMAMFYMYGGTVNVSGGTLDASYGMFNINNKGGSGSVYVSDGLFKVCETGDVFQITNGSAAKPGTFVITGGTFEASDTAGFVKYSSPYEASSFTIKGGTFTGARARLFYMTKCKGTFTIEGGTFIATNSSNLIYVGANNTGWFNIEGGTFIFEPVGVKNVSDHALLNIAAKTEAYVKISGGVFVDQRKGNMQTFLKMNGFAEVILCGDYKVYTTEQKDYLFYDYDNKIDGSLYFIPTVFKETWEGDGKQYYVQSGFGTENDVLTVKTAQLRPVYDGFGIRWSASITAANIQALTAKGTLSYGTLIFPTEYLPKWYENADLHAALKGAAASKGMQEAQVFVDVAAQNGIVTDEAGNVTFSASLINIKKENEARSFTGIPYVLVTAADGTKTYYYATTSTGAANMTYQIAVRNCLSDISESAGAMADGRVYCYLLAEQTAGFRRIAPRMQTILLMSLPEEMRAAFIPQKEEKK